MAKAGKRADNPFYTPQPHSQFPPNHKPSKSEYAFFALSFQFASAAIFPLFKKQVYRVKVDGSCPFCSAGQVWADNCQVCAAETDDYRLYCLSQAQSTLIQQSHLYLIYDSLSVLLSVSLTLALYTFSLYAFRFLLWPVFLRVYFSGHFDWKSAALSIYLSFLKCSELM